MKKEFALACQLQIWQPLPKGSALSHSASSFHPSGESISVAFAGFSYQSLRSDCMGFSISL
jgi:hypothetical protein